MIYLRGKRNIILIAVGVTLVISIIVVVFIAISSAEQGEIPVEPENINVEELEMQFTNIFNNEENENVEIMYHIKREESGEYTINADIPYVHISNEIDNKINREINDIFVNEIVKVINENDSYTVLTIDFTSSINNNIISLAIRCILKEGNNAQRTIIKTYNYNLDTNQEVDILELIPEDKRESLQEEIDKKIQGEIKKEQTIIDQGFNVYRRDPDSEIYILENATEFYVKDNILYIIYSYGNNSYTSTLDLIITKI